MKVYVKPGISWRQSDALNELNLNLGFGITSQSQKLTLPFEGSKLDIMFYVEELLASS